MAPIILKTVLTEVGRQFTHFVFLMNFGENLFPHCKHFPDRQSQQ